jgi:hypothetical protein
MIGRQEERAFSKDFGRNAAGEYKMRLLMHLRGCEQLQGLPLTDPLRNRIADFVACEFPGAYQDQIADWGTGYDPDHIFKLTQDRLFAQFVENNTAAAPAPRKRGLPLKVVFAGGLLIAALSSDPNSSDAQDLAAPLEALAP